MSWICQDCKEFASMNVVAFAWGSISNVGFALFHKENKANTKKAEELICCISKVEDKRKIFTEITDLAEGETSLISLSTRFVFQFIPKTIITKFCSN